MMLKMLWLITSIMRDQSPRSRISFWEVNSHIRNGRHLGPHALRSTFASELLAEKVPYDAIRVILGHTDPGSTRFYTKMSIEDLRTCALAVPPPSGLFAEYLKGVSI